MKKGKSGPRSLTRINTHPVPRDTMVLLSTEQWVSATVVGPVTETHIQMGRHHLCHRLVMVHIRGEHNLRRVEYTRLTEFSNLEIIANDPEAEVE
ncbi:MAG: hypothetical protein HC882_00815 [Acidobacteria bacterium]|nr:hypothetical protein [Acidobacteriota bacterium]